ncbi:hypothetical protein CLUG_01700 [Clavispora lusitaniae ATCC 42720]|uniref:Uncharacterized protein n=1 Tax=Clavispora lusitaniae (strain ATCC 42720) TaxID=306902 RepID=C4Y0G8_CLAL4|nr:uncharacterized protein CLUG_01700 [Clavispora lusitaniae ATCC 42720]EEQ37577.1 hypothetical protein CLUG_01700 [Clavispora lusitaniae ATCC 42720]
MLTQFVTKPVITVTSHGHGGQVSDRISQGQSQKEIRFSKLGTEHSNPKKVRHPHIQSFQLVEVSSKSLRSHVSSRSLCQVRGKQTTQRHNSEENHSCYSNEETNNRNDVGRLRDRSQTSPIESVNHWSKVEEENQNQKHQTTSQMSSTGPFSWNEHPFK